MLACLEILVCATRPHVQCVGSAFDCVLADLHPGKRPVASDVVWTARQRLGAGLLRLGIDGGSRFLRSRISAHKGQRS